MERTVIVIVILLMSLADDIKYHGVWSIILSDLNWIQFRCKGDTLFCLQEDCSSSPCRCQGLLCPRYICWFWCCI